MPNITIDDRPIAVPNGTLIVQAARMLGVEVPVFCYHSRLSPVGMCRMCLVEVGTPRMSPDRKPVLKPDGTPEIAWMPKPQTACTTTVSEGMVVKAYSPAAVEARKGIVEFLLTSHPLDCPICDKGGECTLQEETLSHGPGQSRFLYNDKFHNEKNVQLGPLIILDRERCIQCSRCIRFQDEIADDRVLGFFDRGRGMEIGTLSNPPFDSKFSGNTTDICPVGALTSEDFRFGARPWEMKYTPSVCTHCAVGCNLTVSSRSQTEIKRILPRANGAVNDIWICDKGRFGHHFATSPSRLKMPLVRKNGELVPASWAEALAAAAHGIGSARVSGGVAGIVGDRLANEDLYLAARLFKDVLRSDNLRGAAPADTLNGEIGLATGSDVSKLGKGNAIFVIGADVEEEAPIAFVRIKQGKESGAALIVANGRPTKLDRYAATLRYRYGADGQVLAAMLNVIVSENLANAEFVAARTSGFEALKAAVKDYAPDGANAEAIRNAARAIAQAKDAVFVCGRELSAAGRTLLRALALVTGHAGRANNGVLPILAHNNSQGANAILPAGKPASAKALYVIGTEAKRDGAQFMVVQDLFLTETAKQADVVLPAQSFAERDGTYTSYERRVQQFAPAILPVGESKPDWQIIAELANALDANWRYAGAGTIFAEMAAQVPAFAGMSYDKLTGKITRSRDHFIYEGTSYQTLGGQGAVYPSAAERTDTTFDLAVAVPGQAADGLLLVAPRVLYDAGTLIGESVLLHAVTPDAYADLNRTDADWLGIHGGEHVRLTVAGKSVELIARVDGRAPQGVVVAPANLKGADTAALLNGAIAASVTLAKA